jgi:NAD+ diphosphatase
MRCGAKLGTRAEAGVERTACLAEGCGFVFYDNPTPVVAAVLQRGEDIVLVRPPAFPEKWFGLVTGFLEREEDPRDGVLREVKEEVGLDGEIRSLIGVYPFKPMNQIIVAYHVVAEGEIVLTDEIAAFKLVPIGKLRPWPLGTGEAVRDFLATRP